MKLNKTSNIFWIFAIILVLINITVYLTQKDNYPFITYFSDGFPVVCSIISIIYISKAIFGFKVFDFTKKAWLFILFGIFLYILGETSYFVLETILKYDMNEVFPSIADYFWCIGYIPLIIGLLILLWNYKKSGFPLGNTKIYVIITLVYFSILALLFSLLLLPILKDKETIIIQKVFYMLYPLGDIFLFLPAVFIFYITSLFGSGSISRPWKMIALGFLCFAVGDILYSYLAWQDLYGSANPLDVLMNFGYLSITLGSIYQKELLDSIDEK